MSKIVIVTIQKCGTILIPSTRCAKLKLERSDFERTSKSTRQIDFPLLIESPAGTLYWTLGRKQIIFSYALLIPEGLSSRLENRYCPRHYEGILKLVVSILLRVLGQVQGFRLTQHWFEYLFSNRYMFRSYDYLQAEIFVIIPNKYSNQCCVRRKPWTWLWRNVRFTLHMWTVALKMTVYHEGWNNIEIPPIC
jgi:hypothetical protein